MKNKFQLFEVSFELTNIKLSFHVLFWRYWSRIQGFQSLIRRTSRNFRHVPFPTFWSFESETSICFLFQMIRDLFLYCFKQLCRAKVKNRVPKGWRHFQCPKSYEKLRFGDCVLSKLDLTSAPWSRIMLSPFCKTQN